MELLLIKPRVEALGATKKENEEMFQISPLDNGLGGAIFGNAIRTALLAHIPSSAVTNYEISIKNDGEYVSAPHIYGTLRGVRNDLMEIFMNIKDMKVKLLNNEKRADIEIERKGPCVVTAADFAIDENVQIINGEHFLFEITSEDEIKLKITVREGKGYQPDEMFVEGEIGNIAVDASFSPVEKVAYEVEPMRVNGVEGFEKLILTIETNGTVAPREALDIACKIIHDGYHQVMEGVETILENDKIFYEQKEEEEKSEIFHTIEELSLTARSTNALKSEAINNTDDLRKLTEKELEKIPNIGKRSFNEIKAKMQELGLEFRQI